MQLRLFYKLFVVIAVAGMLGIVLFGVTTHWYLNRSFERFVAEAVSAHSAALINTLEAHYADHGNLSQFSEQPRQWRRLVREHRLLAPPDNHSAPIPPGPPPPRGIGRTVKPRFNLYTADKTLLSGARPARRSEDLLPITHAGETVGWLGVSKPGSPLAGRERRLQQRQGTILLIAAAISAALAIVIAGITAARLSRPLRQISEATRSLTSGNTDIHLPPAGKDEIGQLIRDVNVLAQTFEKNESARRRWFADVSHELRTPLASLQAEIEAVDDGIRQNDAAFIRSIRHETDRLRALVNDLYQLACADLGSLSYEFDDTSLSALVTAALSRFSARFEAAGLTFEHALDARVQIRADGRRIAQLLDNLLENCCRYVSSPGVVKIELKRIDGDARLCVSDSGPGVDAALLPTLFDPLSRGELSRSREFGGAGLGLAICQRIVSAHNGSMSAENRDGGLAVSVTLPLSQ